MLVEIQALAAKAGFGTPQRVATGFDGRRLALLLAVLDKRAGLPFAQLDVFLNVVGGVRLQEPAGDLAVAAALASSVYDRALPRDAVFLGEVGLGGEIRPVSQAERRLAEAANMGMTTAYRRPSARVADIARRRRTVRLFAPSACARRRTTLFEPRIFATRRVELDAHADAASRTSASSSSPAAAARRVGGEELKQFRWVAGKPMLLHSVQTFMAHPTSRMVVVRAAASATPAIRRPGSSSATSTGCWSRSAGATRSGVGARTAWRTCPTRSTIVLVHDAARPLVDATRRSIA